MRENNYERCMNLLDEIIQATSGFSTNENIKIHLHTKEAQSFLRTWENEKKGDSLESFRNSLLKIKETHQPLSGVELGRSGILIRGISPIFYNDTYIGSIEVLSTFEKITNYFISQKIDFFVLIDKKFADIPLKLSNIQLKILDKYIIANKHDDLESLMSLNEVSFENSMFFKKDGYFFASIPIYDIKQQQIGYYLLRINTSDENYWYDIEHPMFSYL